jgi:FKBP-type peptidyl-prolyl cis-trans isomerase 2
MGNAKIGDKIKVRYTGKLESGKVFDKTKDNLPMVFRIGGGKVVPEFENAVTGMEVGGRKTVTIPPEKAFGLRHQDLIVDFKRSEFPGKIEMFLGKRIDLHGRNGLNLSVKIVSIDEETVRVDANHPLKGETLIFDIELLEIY